MSESSAIRQAVLLARRWRQTYFVIHKFGCYKVMSGMELHCAGIPLDDVVFCTDEEEGIA
jgi:hypothetical protein